MDKKTIEFYNKNAHRYAEWRSKESADLSQRIFLNEVKLNGKIIDLGCGTGEKAIWFNKKGLKVDAVDASLEMLEKFKQFKDINTKQIDLSKIMFLKKYDGVWASFSIQHLERNIQDSLIKKISNTLNKNGIFYIGIHEGNKSYRDNLHRLYVPRSETELKKILKKNKLQIFNFFKENNFSFDNKPIKIMHIFSKLIG